ncbi:MAG TPA: hypothetical protein VIK79_01045, partial [Xanthobacteraceae bacterium]
MTPLYLPLKGGGIPESPRPARGAGPALFKNPEEIADAVIARVGKHVVLGLPLGLGKANHVANALFARALTD